jgi:hypothetical protein
LIEVGGEILVDIGLWPESDVRTLEFLMYVVGAACPMGGQYFTFVTASWPVADSRLSLYIAQVIVLLATIGCALGILALTLLTFDRCVGRMSERPRRAPRPPRRAAVPRVPVLRRPVLPNPVSVT